VKNSCTFVLFQGDKGEDGRDEIGEEVYDFLCFAFLTSKLVSDKNE